jgi:hypothetical protein
MIASISVSTATWNGGLPHDLSSWSVLMGWPCQCDVAEPTLAEFLPQRCFLLKPVPQNGF